MEGQGQRDRYGNPVRQPSQSYPHGYNVPGQGFASGYGSQGRSQSQMAGQAQNYGTEQATSQRPDSSGYAYPHSALPYQNPQLPQYGREFSTDAAQPQHYSSMMSYYQPPNVYDPSYRQHIPGQSQVQSQQQIQTEPFPFYSEPSSQYSAPPQAPSQIRHYSQGYIPRPRTDTGSSYTHTPISAGYQSGFEPGQMHPPPVQPQQQQQQVEAPRPNEGYRLYLRKLRETYEHINTNRLEQGGQSLLDASEALLTRVEELGLTKDSENLQEQRLKMWKNFNLCWLAFMQRLKDALEEVLQTGQQPVQPQSIVTLAFLDVMGDRLIAWADSIEKWGLVDYETGVWEEEILEVASDCRSILETNPDIFGSA